MSAKFSLSRKANLVRAFVRRSPDISQLAYTGRRAVVPCVLLPFVTDIPVRSYLNQAFPLSIVVQNPDYHKALFGSFVQLFFPENKLEYDRVLMLPSLFAEDWERLGFVDLLTLDTHAASLSNPGDFINLLIEQLHDGSYAETWIDEYFLPGRLCHHKVHSVHDNLVIGYDLKQRVFHLAGYGQDYEVCPVSFQEISRAFHHMPKSQLKMRRLRFIRPQKLTNFDFDLVSMRAQLRDYLDSSITLSADTMQTAQLYWKARRFTGSWGLNTYYAFIEYLTRMREERKLLDLRATRTLWEHKACMLARLKFLESANCFTSGLKIADSYAPVEELAKIVRFQAYEYNVCGLERHVITSIVETLNNMRTSEASVLREVYTSLTPAAA